MLRIFGYIPFVIFFLDFYLIYTPYDIKILRTEKCALTKTTKPILLDSLNFIRGVYQLCL